MLGTNEFEPDMFFAHSLNGQNQTNWQPLAMHLQEVSRLTSSRAEKFGAGRLGALIGLLHDLGKYAPAFQDYIAGRAPSPDHATAGAREIQKFASAGGSDHLAALIGAYCIAGHHSGLPNWHGERALNNKRLSVLHIAKIKSACHVSKKGRVVSMWPPIDVTSAGKRIQR